MLRVIPVLLLDGKGLVKTKQFKDPVYIGDPINAVRIFNEKFVDELVFLDVTASVENREPSYSLLEQMTSQCFMPLAYGGGVKNLKQIERIISLGVEKISVNTAAFERVPQFIEEAAKRFGSQAIIGSIDVRKKFLGGYEVCGQRAQQKLRTNVIDFARELESRGVGEILLTSVDREGTMAGYDIRLIEEVSKAVKVPVIAHGGAGKLDDFAAAARAGASAVAAGSYFVFHGKYRAVLITYPKPEEITSILC